MKENKSSMGCERMERIVLVVMVGEGIRSDVQINIWKSSKYVWTMENLKTNGRCMDKKLSKYGSILKFVEVRTINESWSMDRQMVWKNPWNGQFMDYNRECANSGRRIVGFETIIGGLLECESKFLIKLNRNRVYWEKLGERNFDRPESKCFYSKAPKSTKWKLAGS